MDPPTYPFEETSFMNGPLHKTKTKADWDLDLGLNFILYEMISLKYIICLHMHQVACRDSW